MPTYRYSASLNYMVPVSEENTAMPDICPSSASQQIYTTAKSFSDMVMEKREHTCVTDLTCIELLEVLIWRNEAMLAGLKTPARIVKRQRKLDLLKKAYREYLGLDG